VAARPPAGGPGGRHAAGRARAPSRPARAPARPVGAPPSRGRCARPPRAGRAPARRAAARRPPLLDRGEQLVELRVPALGRQRVGVAVGERADRRRQRLVGRHPRAVEEHRHDRARGGEAGLDLAPHPVARIVQAPAALRVPGIQPARPDEHEHHVAAADRVRDALRPFLARGDRVGVLEHGARSPRPSRTGSRGCCPPARRSPRARCRRERASAAPSGASPLLRSGPRGSPGSSRRPDRRRSRRR